jgi:3-oxoadipate enol-lactonase
MERWFTEGFRKAEHETVARVRSILEGTPPAGYIACAKVVREGLGGNVEEISVPTLVMTGTFDAAAKPEDCKNMAAQIERSRYVELNAAHITPIEASAQFSDALAAFVEEQSKAVSSGR